MLDLESKMYVACGMSLKSEKQAFGKMPHWEAHRNGKTRWKNLCVTRCHILDNII